MHNPLLAEARGISKEDRNLIDVIHEELYEICEDPQKVLDKGFDPVLEIEKREYELQGLWGFDKSKDHHTWWLKIKGCTCPEMDNQDHFGTPYRVYNGNCPWHGRFND